MWETAPGVKIITGSDDETDTRLSLNNQSPVGECNPSQALCTHLHTHARTHFALHTTYNVTHGRMKTNSMCDIDISILLCMYLHTHAHSDDYMCSPDRVHTQTVFYSLALPSLCACTHALLPAGARGGSAVPGDVEGQGQLTKYFLFVKENWHRLIGTSIGWFVWDVCFYGEATTFTQ